MAHERDGELEGCMEEGCTTQLLFKGKKPDEKHGFVEKWYCPDHDKIILFTEDGQILES